MMPKAIKVHLVVLMMAIVKKPSTSLQKKIVEKVILVKYLLVQEKIKPMQRVQASTGLMAINKYHLSVKAIISTNKTFLYKIYWEP